jgi:hypothetical protein
VAKKGDSPDFDEIAQKIKAAASIWEAKTSLIVESVLAERLDKAIDAMCESTIMRALGLENTESGLDMIAANDNGTVEIDFEPIQQKLSQKVNDVLSSPAVDDRIQRVVNDGLDKVITQLTLSGQLDDMIMRAVTRACAAKVHEHLEDAVGPLSRMVFADGEDDEIVDSHQYFNPHPVDEFSDFISNHNATQFFWGHDR